jgi:hypothetical protein
MVSLVLGPLLRHVGENAVTVWVETDTPCEVTILGRAGRTFTAHGHHYALVLVDGLPAGSCQEYTVELDGHAVWPLPGSPYPPSVIRTLAPGATVRVVFGSCRHGTPDAIGRQHGYAPDALDTYAQRMTRTDIATWPDVLVLLGDQVYADETSPSTQEFIAARRPLDEPPGPEVADFEEYTQLYYESWGDPDVRWLLSTVPSAMIFDDHDVRDDWNTSQAWRERMQATTWWHSRITGGLTSYWIYQHIGNLTPEGLAADRHYQRVHEVDDAGPVLDGMAMVADAEVDDIDAALGSRWSYRLDFGRVRLVMIDSRCGRVLPEAHRSMLSPAEFAWIEEQAEGDYDHLLVGSSLPWLLPPAIHHVESWNEALASGSRGPRVQRWSERLRQAADLEHWAAFRSSFDRLTRLLGAAARGELGGDPASVLVLSGDVHHGYVARALYPQTAAAPVYQITCSPVHNAVPGTIKVGFRAGWSRLAAAIARPLARSAGVARLPIRWKRLGGPYFGNLVATLVLDGTDARLEVERACRDGDGPPYLTTLDSMPLTPPARPRPDR